MATESESGDAISYLPDETLAQILSYLPTKQAASTTTLSKRWRTPFTRMISLFSSQHHLDFDQSYFLNPKKGKRRRRRRQVEIKQSFREFVDKTLSCNKPLNKFSLKYREDLHNVSQTNQWINNALERSVSELDLRITLTCRSPRPLPSSIFTSKTLVKLTLGKALCIGTEPPKVFLPLLKSLSLDTVYVLNTVWVHRGDFWSVMLQGCPQLEELFLDYFYNDPPRQPDIITHKTLKRLTTRIRYQQIFCETPSLVYFDYSYYSTVGMNAADDLLDSLVEARLDLDILMEGRIRPFRMNNITAVIGCMINVEILHISSNTVKVFSRLGDYWKYGCCNSFPRFENLVKLSFETDMELGWEQLTIMIDNAPKLETIVFKGLHCISYTGVCVDANVVKVLEIYGYRGSGNELRQLKRFLSQMDRLQVIKVEIDAAIDDDDKKLQITNDLLALPKCQIQFL